MWYYAKDGLQAGPVGDGEMEVLIRDGTVTGATLVWKAGMADWQSAALAGLVKAVPPVARLAPDAPPPLSPSAYSPPDPVPAPAAAAPKGDRSLAVLAHVLALFAGFIGPLIILLAAPDEDAKAHARRALNWKISFAIYFLASFLLVFVVVGIPLLAALALCDMIFCIVAAVKAGNGVRWDYPMAIRFLKD